MISTNTHTYLLTFENTNEGLIVGDAKELGDVLINFPKRIVKSIKIYQPSSFKFVRLSKNDLNNFTSWETETTKELDKRKLI